MGLAISLTAVTTVHAQQLNLRTYRNVDGLPQTQALAVYQDRQGYMWFGTYGGLARYDGRHFEAFTADDGLAGNVVQAIVERADGELLVGTVEGLTLYDGATFTDIPMPDGTQIVNVRSLYPERDGTVWAATGSGLLRVSGAEVQSFGVPEGLASGAVLSVYRTSRGQLLVGTQAGLFTYRQAGFAPVAARRLAGRAVQAILEDERGVVWLGTDAGLFRGPASSVQQVIAWPTPGPPRPWINGATVGVDGLLWLATRQGVLRWDGERFERLTQGSGLANDNVRAVCVDREGDVWLGTDTGVSKLVPGPFANYSTLDGLPGDFVRDVAEGPGGRIWLGTRGGIGIIEPDGRVRGLGPAEGVTETHGFAIAPLADGSVLYGTETGLVQWADGRATVYTTADGLPSDAATALLVLRSGEVLVGTRQGVARWVPPANASSGDRPRAAFRVLPELAGLHIVDMEQDAGGRVWLSTLGGRLYTWDGESLDRLDARYALHGTIVWSLAADAEGGIWLGTNGLGALHVRGESMQWLSTREGLVNDFVWQLLADSHGHVWLYTNRGLDRWDGDTFHHYDGSDGLADLEGSLDAALEDSRGRLWFGNGRGVLRFDPSAPLGRPVPPPVVVRGLTVDGSAFPVRDEVSIPAGSDNLSLSFAGLTFRDERDVAFRFRLLGLSDKWSPATPEGSISYVRLPPRAYIFEVQARSSSGVWSTEPARVHLEVAPTLLQTVWVRLLSIPALLLVVAGVYTARHRHLTREKKRLAALVAERTKDLARSEQRFRTALANSSTSVFHQDAQLRYTWAYSRWDFLQADAIIGRTDEEVWSVEAAAILTELKRRALRDGEGIRERVALPALGSTRYFHVALEPARDAQGEIVGLTSAMIDETDRHDLEARLHQSQKLEAVGQLAGGIAHDFNNLLTGITGYTELALAETPAGSQLTTDLCEVRDFCRRAAGLIQQLLAFGRRQTLDAVVLDVSELVEDATKMLRRLIREDVELEVRTGGRITAEADRGQLEQVLVNLVVNARDAVAEGGRIVVTTTAAEVGAAAAAELEVEPGPYAVLEVADDGMGIDPRMRDKIFEPFFTTKDVDKGTGLGLATVYGIVRQHHGAVSVDSALGEGTVFRVYLPAAAEGAAPEAEEDGPPAPGVGAETILLVEDNDAVQRLAARALEQQGYTVLVADSPCDALRLFEEHVAEIDLLVTDVVMPGCSGTGLWAQLCDKGANCRVVFMSGYPDLKEKISAQGYDGASLLPKPFTPQSLGRAVRQALDSWPPAQGQADAAPATTSESPTAIVD